MLLCFRWNHKTTMKGLIIRTWMFSGPTPRESIAISMFLTMNDFPAQSIRNMSETRSNTIPSFELAYLLESSPPKKVELGAYCLVDFSSTSSWLNNPERRKRCSGTLATQLSTQSMKLLNHNNSFIPITFVRLNFVLVWVLQIAIHHATFVPATLGKLDIVGVRFKNTDSPTAGPFHRRLVVSALWQARDLRCWTSNTSWHNPGLYACNDNDQMSRHDSPQMRLVKAALVGTYKRCLAHVIRKFFFFLNHTIEFLFRFKTVTYHQVLSVDGWVQRCSLLLAAQYNLTTRGQKHLISRLGFYKPVHNIMKDVIA